MTGRYTIISVDPKTHDADYFIGSLRNGIGPVEGYYGRTCVTFMVTFSKEVWGSYRGKTMNSDYYRDDIRKAVIEARKTAWKIVCQSVGKAITTRQLLAIPKY